MSCTQCVCVCVWAKRDICGGGGGSDRQDSKGGQFILARKWTWHLAKNATVRCENYADTILIQYYCVKQVIACLALEKCRRVEMRKGDKDIIYLPKLTKIFALPFSSKTICVHALEQCGKIQHGRKWNAWCFLENLATFELLNPRGKRQSKYIYTHRIWKACLEGKKPEMFVCPSFILWPNSFKGWQTAGKQRGSAICDTMHAAGRAPTGKTKSRGFSSRSSRMSN